MNLYSRSRNGSLSPHRFIFDFIDCSEHAGGFRSHASKRCPATAYGKNERCTGAAYLNQ